MINPDDLAHDIKKAGPTISCQTRHTPSRDRLSLPEVCAVLQAHSVLQLYG